METEETEDYKDDSIFSCLGRHHENSTDADKLFYDT